MTLPKKRKRPRMGVRVCDVIRSPGHLAWVRIHMCCIRDCEYPQVIEAAHVRIGTDGGTAMKPGDCYAIPLCTKHHAEQHQIGEQSFEKRYGINMKAIAEGLWKQSPHRLKWEAKQRDKTMAG